ncbi:TPA: sigma-54-dependent Fis family transcriptional regulator [bacterium]|nr:sigma-54-dependent Fis family transcriptional regulator [bacterium]
MAKIWYHFFECSIPYKAKIIETLTTSGLDMYNLDIYNLDNNINIGIVFFDKFTAQLCDFLYKISHNGIKRVLVIALSTTGLGENNTWHLLQSGASDVFCLDHSAETIKKIIARLNRWNDIEQLIESPVVRNNLIGQSPAWRSTLRQIGEIAYFTNSSLLIIGETGTGKELIARLIHTLDQRPNKRDLVLLDCTTIVPELSGSEFFGHERGAFTGAITAREGAFELANNGTLFLDEVGELPLKLQAQLLRVIQEHSFKRVGGNTWHSTDFRLVSATNKDLMQELREGRFRSDLYYRIANWTFKLQPLRERKEDILPLTKHFIKQIRPDEEPPYIDNLVQEYLLRRDYPGNIRDLKYLVSRIMCRYVGPGPITIGDLPKEEYLQEEFGPINWSEGHLEHAIRQALLFGIGLKEIRRVVEDIAINIAVSEENGSLQRAAQRLGVTDRALQMRRAADRRNK